MLIEFSTANFRSVKETQKLTLVAGTGKEHQEQNSFDSGLPGFPRLLRSAVIYGANAAGKTNLLRALQFMQGLVLGSATFQQETRVAHSPFRQLHKHDVGLARGVIGWRASRMRKSTASGHVHHFSAMR